MQETIITKLYFGHESLLHADIVLNAEQKNRLYE